MWIIGIDPGPLTSAAVCWDAATQTLISVLTTMNEEMLERVVGWVPERVDVAIESLQSYGMRVGAETFTTGRWVGRFEQGFLDRQYPVTLYSRPKVKGVLLERGDGNDADIRRSLLLRYPHLKPSRTARACLKSHEWAALAVAVCHAEVSRRPRDRR